MRFFLSAGRSEPPRFAHRSAKVEIRFVVAHKLLLDRVPSQRSAQTIGDAAQMRDGDGPMADLDAGAGPRPCANRA